MIKKIFSTLFGNTKKIIISICGLLVLGGIVAVVAIKVLSINSNLCNVYFETNGGSTINSQQIKCGRKAKKPEQPVKEGFNFIDWYNGIEVFDFNNVINTDLKLFAKWEIEPGQEFLLVHFDTDGGTSILDYQVVKGNSITEPISPTKEGFKFSYWQLNDKKFDFNDKILEEITLKAIWVENGKNSTNSVSNGNSNNDIIKSDKYDCWGGFKKSKGEEKHIYLYETWDFDYLWNDIGMQYAGSDKCYVKYIASASGDEYTQPEAAKVDQNGKIEGTNLGLTYISKCIVDKKTDSTVSCFQGVLVTRRPDWKIKNLKVTHTEMPIYPDEYVDYTFVITGRDDYKEEDLSIQLEDNGVAIMVDKIFSKKDNTLKLKFKALTDGTASLIVKGDGVAHYGAIIVQKRPNPITKIEVTEKNITMEVGEFHTFAYKTWPSDADMTIIQWSSKDDSLLDYYSDGKFYAKKAGSTDIIVTAATINGPVTDTCHVIIKEPEIIIPPLSASGSIGYTISVTSSGTYSGVKAEVNASGGSGSYKYEIILYKDGNKVSYRPPSSINNTVAYAYGNGTYTADYIVTDSDGETISGTLGPTVISMP